MNVDDYWFGHRGDGEEITKRRDWKRLCILDFEQWRRRCGEVVWNWGKSHFDDLSSNLAPLVFLEIVKSGENAPGKYNTHLMRDVPLAVRDTISIKQHSGQNILPGGQSKRVRTWHMACGN